MIHDPTMALRMEQVSKQYPGTLAVDRVDFEVRAGEIHALMGENGAGKSTLMKMLAGSFADYTGRIFVEGKEVALHSPAMARSHGIGMIYQELSLARPISIAENLLAGHLPRTGKIWLDRQAMVQRAAELLQRVGLDLDPMKTVAEISQHEAQLVEIARVLGTEPRVLVMDEPTSALSREEVQRLFTIMRSLQQRGLAIVYISHHLSEIFEVADRVTVLRDGRWIDTQPLSEVTPAQLVQRMVGQTLDTFYARRTSAPGEPVLDVRMLTRKGFFHQISFAARRGEILGLAGLTGAGRSEMARSLCGLDPLDAGDIELAGIALSEHSYGEAMQRGLFYLSEDRKQDGLFLRLSVRQNMVAALIRRHTRGGLYRTGHEKRCTQQMIDVLDISTPSHEAAVNTLSGGNQQKVLLGKWLLAKPAILILDEPSRGVDVKAKQKIHEAIIELADEGHTVLLISSDLPELVGLSDRVIVMHNGHLVGELPADKLCEESVLLAMNGDLSGEG